MRWLKTNKNCPICRQNITGTDKLIAIVNDTDKNNDDKNIILSKEETLIKIINNKPTGKFLIFSKNEKLKSAKYSP